ncbi:MAG: glycosyltransferase family 2 protein [Prevotella sp.]|nr:glycosyltransferase family 2 protein [Prevotella sp.]
MKRTAIFCVNYNSYPELYNYLDSISIAAKEVEGAMNVDVYVADNTDKQYQEISYKTTNFHLRVFPFHQNLGYFGAIKKMMESVPPANYDYAIISNVDIRLHTNTLSLLCNFQADKHTGWIAPAIISKSSGNNLSPQAVHRYSLSKLRLLWLSFRFPFIHYLYAHTLHKRKLTKKTHNKGIIYAGHGSCIILTREYFNRCGIINYPIFLYEEEIYIAEECRTHGLTAIFNPSIVIHDIGRVSTGKTNWKENYQWHAEGLEYILKKYY